MLTKGHFTRDEWNHLLRLFNIMNFSMFSSSNFLSIKKPNPKLKRAQERRTGEEPVVAKSKPVSLVSRNPSAKQSPSLDSGASYRQVNQGLCRNSVFTCGKVVKNPTVSSQGWQRNDNPCSSAGKPVREMSQRSSAGETGGENWEPTYKDEVGPPQSSSLWQSIHWESLHECSTKVASLWGRPDAWSKSQCMDMGLFMSTTMKAAGHLGQHYNENLVTYRNTNFDALKTLFDTTQKLILDNNHEILNVSTIEWHSTPWMRSTL